MYIIKYRSRRDRDPPNTFYWVVCKSYTCRTIEQAVEVLFDVVNNGVA